ncbi:MAG: PAS domain-containing protein, partial [Blastococcus sp.]
MLQVRLQDPDLDQVTTAPVLGQPAAAYPTAPRTGRAGLFAVPALLVAVAAVLGVVLSASVAPRLLFALGGLVVPVSIQAALYARQRRLAGDLQRSQSSFRTLVKSTVDPVVILDEQLRITFASQAVADMLGLDPAGISGMAVLDAVHP